MVTGVKRPRREAHRPPPYSAEVKSAWSYTSTPPYVFVLCLVKQGDKLPYYNLAISSVLELMDRTETGIGSKWTWFFSLSTRICP
jgi:hypothetical protein